MTESIITISIAGLLAGFIFSMPIAGPISILITSNALKGRTRYCNLVSAGASLATFTYVFFAVFGITKLYHFYKPAIPYLFSCSSVFLLFLGYKIYKTDIDIEHIEDKSLFNEKIKKKERGGFYTGSIINFLNPTLFLGWLTSTFLVISFVGSLGFKTGGLDTIVDQSVKEMSSIEDSISADLQALPITRFEAHDTQGIESNPKKQATFPVNFHLVISIFYALFLAGGSMLWFYILTLLISRFRKHINIKFISVFIKSLGVVLCIFGLYFGFLVAKMFLI